MAWRQVRVMSVLNPGEPHHTEANACHPVSLLCFLVKMMEKLVDRHIRNCVLKEYPLHQNQYVYQTEKSIETAFHSVVTCIEGTTEHQEIALGAFLI
jgi:hypothetical protein